MQPNLKLVFPKLSMRTIETFSLSLPRAYEILNKQKLCSVDIFTDDFHVIPERRIFFMRNY